VSTTGLYLTGCEPATGKSAVALGLQHLLARRITRLGVFRPAVADPERPDDLLELLRPAAARTASGVAHEQVRADEAAALEEIVARYHALAADCDGVLVVGSDYSGAGTAGELGFDARVALNLGLPVVCVVSGHRRAPEEVRSALTLGLTYIRRAGADVVAVIANRVPEAQLEGVRAGLGDSAYAMPEVPLLMAPTVAQAAEACGGEVIAGDPRLLGRETASSWPR
jgi:phosphate acetyltransferase